MIAKDIAELMIAIQRDEAAQQQEINKSGPAVKGENKAWFSLYYLVNFNVFIILFSQFTLRFYLNKILSFN